MKKTRRGCLPLGAFGGVVAVAAAGYAAQGCGDASCTPEAHGLGDAVRLELRMLPGEPNGTAPCANEGQRILRSEAELHALYDALGFELEDHPAVDFARERVIVNESVKSEGVQWAVRRGETAVVGLLGCGFPSGKTCVTQVAAVPALVTAVEARSCEPVRCGRPVLTPPR